jgi:two-component system chemotaxis response regulator CheY
MTKDSAKWHCDPDDVRILIVDDDGLIRQLLRSTLHELDHNNVVEASSGELALASCQERWPHLIFLDIEMPGVKNGMAVLNELRATERSVYIIMVTAHSTIHNVRQAAAQRVDGFLVKPLDTDRIRKAVENFHRLGC